MRLLISDSLLFVKLCYVNNERKIVVIVMYSKQKTLFLKDECTLMLTSRLSLSLNSLWTDGTCRRDQKRNKAVEDNLERPFH